MTKDLNTIRDLATSGTHVADIARITGMPFNRVKKIMQTNGIHVNAEFVRNERRRNIMEKCHSDEVHRKLSRSIKYIHWLERNRVLSGKPQQTKYKVSMVPKRIQRAAYNLCHLYGYIRPNKDDYYNFLYDDDTHRVRCEGYYERRYGFTFKQHAT